MSNVIEIARHKSFRLTADKRNSDSVELAESIATTAKNANISKAEFVHNALLNACNLNSGIDSNSFDFSSDALDKYDNKSEQDLINLVLQDNSLIDLAKKCLVTYAKRQYQSNKKLNRDGSERKKATTDIVQGQLESLVEAQMLANDKAQEWFDKRAINSTFLQKGGKEDSLGRTTGIKNKYSFNSVKSYLDANKALIDEHHAKHGMTGNFNQKVSNELKRIAKQGNK